MRPRGERHPAHARRAFTLIEATASLAVMAVLMLGLSGAIMIGSYAIPDPVSVGANDQAMVDALNRLRDELRDASTIQITSNASGVRMVLDLKDTGIYGNQGRVTYQYEDSADRVTRKVQTEAETVFVSGVTGLDVAVITEGSTPIALRVRARAPETIQGSYEMHAMLPQAPEVK